MSDYFYGWYFRCQGEDGTLAVIPAVHRADGKWSCSVQVITEQESWNTDFPIRQFRINRRKGIMQIGENVFSQKGIRLNLEGRRESKILSVEEQSTHGQDSARADSWQIKGILRFGPFTMPAYDIMGPFRFLPGMECIHAVYSMEHSVNGELEINGQRLRFRDGQGYLEGDSGRSFPKKYVWTQHRDPASKREAISVRHLSGSVRTKDGKGRTGHPAGKVCAGRAPAGKPGERAECSG